MQASHCSGFSSCGARALGVRAPVVVAHGLSCAAACGIFPDQGLNPCPLHWQVDGFLTTAPPGKSWPWLLNDLLVIDSLRSDFLLYPLGKCSAASKREPNIWLKHIFSLHHKK